LKDYSADIYDRIVGRARQQFFESAEGFELRLALLARSGEATDWGLP
jgi:hypothetical protein